MERPSTGSGPVQARHQCPLSYQAWVAAGAPGPDGFRPTSLLRADAAGDETRFGKQGPAILWYRRLPSYRTAHCRHQPINTDSPGPDADDQVIVPIQVQAWRTLSGRWSLCEESDHRKAWSCTLAGGFCGAVRRLD